MKHPALAELLSLFPSSDHEIIKAWAEKWVIQLTREQSVVSRKYINSPYEDFIKETIAHNMIDSLLESVLEYDVEDKRYTAEMFALRRKTNGFRD